MTAADAPGAVILLAGFWRSATAAVAIDLLTDNPRTLLVTYDADG